MDSDNRYKCADCLHEFSAPEDRDIIKKLKHSIFSWSVTGCFTTLITLGLVANVTFSCFLIALVLYIILLFFKLILKPRCPYCKSKIYYLCEKNGI